MRGGMAVASPMALGTSLGKLTLLEQIGEGGMARIFLARARGIGGFEKLVVVKQILPRLAEDAEFIARFFQEAQLAATLDHPNIATVYDVDQEGSSYFYSMEYVHGRDLHKVIRRAQQRGRALSVGEIIAIVSGLCAGLHHAHTRLGPDGQPLGIVHRDVSPSNVLLSFEGAVKLADFGVAKARTGMVTTEAGTLRGKLGYMSPEQCRGEALDRRSDVYAVGVLLWELLTGQRLHQGESEVAIIHRIARVPAPSPRAHRPDLGEELERLVARALAVEPALRFPSARTLQAELEEHARQLRLATSARTIAALMLDLFGEEEARDPLGQGSATESFLRRGSGEAVPGEAVPREDGTLPTVTVAPVAPPAPEPALATSTPALEVATGTIERRRSWAGVGVGLGLGVLLGGGGLYMASGPAGESARPVDRESLERAPSAATKAVIEPAAAAEPGEPDESHDRSDARAAATGPAADPPAEPDPVQAEAEAEAEPMPRPSAKRRKSRHRRASSSSAPRTINLDSALPPG